MGRFCRLLERRPAERTFRDDVNEVRTLATPQIEQRAPGRQAQSETGITRQREAAHQHFFGSTAPHRNRIAILPRAHQLNLVIARAQFFNDARHTQRHAIDFGWIRLRDKGDTQRFSVRHCCLREQAGLLVDSCLRRCDFSSPQHRVKRADSVSAPVSIGCRS